MTEFVKQMAGAAWEVAGRRVASSLDAATSALVVGDDPVAAAHAALGIARVQAARRRVAIADLVGDVPPLQELVTGDDPHGITDSFQYGVSLSRIARQVDEVGSFFVLPSGSEPVITPDVLRSERWRPLVESFGGAGALLLFVAPAGASGVDALARLVDGAVLVGDADVHALGGVRTLAVIAPPAPTGYSMTPTPDTGAEAIANAPPAAAAPAPGGRRVNTPLVAGGVLAAAAALYLLFGRADAPADVQPPAPAVSSASSPPPVRGGDALDSVTAARVPDPPPPTATGPGGLLILNPGDSAAAANFTVLLATFPSADRARVRVAQDSPDVPAATVAPTPEAVGERHQYLAGAYVSRAQADSLLQRLRRRAAVGSRGGSVVSRPLAFLLRERVPADSVASLTRGLSNRGVPAYALVQGDGSVRLYAGAYESAEQAARAAEALQRAGVPPTLAYRTGRPR